jgi:hypothetical protein
MTEGNQRRRSMAEMATVKMTQAEFDALQEIKWNADWPPFEMGAKFKVETRYCWLLARWDLIIGRKTAVWSYLEVTDD